MAKRAVQCRPLSAGSLDGLIRRAWDVLAKPIDVVSAARAAGREVKHEVLLFLYGGVKVMIGTLGLLRFDFEHRHAELGYEIARRLWGRGLTPEVVAAVIRYGFSVLRLHRIGDSKGRFHSFRWFSLLETAEPPEPPDDRATGQAGRGWPGVRSRRRRWRASLGDRRSSWSV